MNLHTYVDLSIYLSIFIYLSLYIYIYIYTYIHTYTLHDISTSSKSRRRPGARAAPARPAGLGAGGLDYPKCDDDVCSELFLSREPKDIGSCP